MNEGTTIRLWRYAVAVALSSGFLSVAFAADPPRKIALVIGNSQYSHLSRLANPVNDAALLGRTLRELGFDTRQENNLSRKGLIEAVRTFTSSIREGDIGLFYYAGHAVQVNGKNYFLPVDAIVPKEADLPALAFNADELIGKLATKRSAANIIILDACRDSPYGEATRSITGTPSRSPSGLAQMDAPKGTLIAFSTAPGKAAFDGKGTNSLYSASLAAQLKVPGLPIEEVFKRVRLAVTAQTQDRQVPWENTSLIGNLTFVPLVSAHASAADSEQTHTSSSAETAKPQASESAKGFAAQDNWSDADLAALWNQRGKPSAREWVSIAEEIDKTIAEMTVEDVEAVKRAASHGNSKSQTILAGLYHAGKVVAKDQKSSEKWYAIAAGNGFAIAQYRLARLKLEERNSSKNVALAGQLFITAMSQGYPPALKDLGALYLGQDRRAYDKAKGKRFIRIAEQAEKEWE